MPELPDVEAIRRYLVRQGLVGRTIKGAELFWVRAVRTPSVKEFESGLSGRKIRAIGRRGKYLVISLGGRPTRKLVLHLAMTGSLALGESRRERPRHTRNVLLLDDGAEICFVDPRKLGAMWLVGDEKEVTARLGPEPLSNSFTTQSLRERLSRRVAPIKALLLDQTLVAGIGNIYADEVLFLARIHPLTFGTRPDPGGRDASA